MRPLAALLSGLLLCTACGEDPAPSTPQAATPTKEDLLQALFEPQADEALQKSIAAARDGGVSEQAILEARFVSLVDAGNHAAIGNLAPELEAAAPKFQLADSAIFSQREEFLAIVQYAHALAALEADDREEFKKHIKEAFWLSPNQGAAFAPHIERLRLTQAMAELKVDFHRPLAHLKSGKPTTLAAVAGEAEHVLLHFWSPWSEECAAFLDDFIATAEEVSGKGVAVTSILSEPAPEALQDATELAASAGARAQGHWLLDNPGQPLNRDLRIMNVPTFVLLHKDGRVLFNGHPAEKELWRQLKLAAPNIKRPAVAPPEADQEPATGQ